MRAYIVNYSGIVAMFLMSLTVILSIRHWPLEQFLRGLDQQYRLHKYLGIATVVMGLVHWLSFLSDDIAMDLGAVAMKEETYPFWKLVDALGDPAQLIGEWGFYLSAAFVLIAWIKFFPHKVFEFTHKAFPYLYLLLVVHMVMFFDADLWLSFIGVTLAMVVFVASVGCVLNILGLNGQKNSHQGVIQSVKTLRNGVEVVVKSQDFSFKPGQFVFVAFDAQEGSHPFSLASANYPNGEVRLLIKASGDYTQTLASKLTAGQAVALEGPYGHFNFDDEVNQHIWVAAGIGIAPFLTAIEGVSAGKSVVLFYSYSDTDDCLIQELKRRAINAGVTLYLTDTRSSPRLRCEDVLKRVNDFSESSVWYCGPLVFGKQLELAFTQANLPQGRFHRELFDFR